LTEDYPIRTIAFPSISTGAYRFPLERAAHIAVGEIKRYLADHTHLEEVRIVCYSDEAFDTFRRAMEQADLLTTEES
jgi:O-acetyl-ADP-ribose deacetylase (regulator of RNase III)